MIRGAALLGCAAAGAGPDLRSAIGTYAQELGVAFQIRDDMLDVIGDEAAFGKPIGSDRADGKVTYVDVLGLEGCENAVRMCTAAARAALAQVPGHERVLDELDFASVDVSFISLKLILPALRGLLKQSGRVVCLVKPQFEAGREKVGKKGVVRDPAVHCEVLEHFLIHDRAGHQDQQ